MGVKMSNFTVESTQPLQTVIDHTTRPRKTYIKPVLIKLGDLRSLTLGSSPDGFKDSSGALFSEDFPKAFSSKLTNPGGPQIVTPPIPAKK
jgi:hypothetical protein